MTTLKTDAAEPLTDELANVEVVAWLHDHGGFSWPDQRNMDRSNAKRMVLLEDAPASDQP